MGWVIAGFGTLQNHYSKDWVPEGAVWDRFAHKQCLEICVRARKVLLLQQPLPSHIFPRKSDGDVRNHALLQDIPINAK